MTISLWFAGVDRTDFLKANSGSVSKQFGERALFTGTIETNRRTWTPVLGQTVEVKIDSNVLFSGILMWKRVVKIQGSSNSKRIFFRCKSHGAIADRRLVSGDVGPNASLFSICSFINANALSGEGISLANVENPGPIVPGIISFNKETVTSALNKVAQAIGYFWDIDSARVLSFKSLAINPCPISLSSTSKNWNDLSVEESLEEYRNVQHVRTDKNVAATRTISFTGDGVTRDFYLPTGDFFGEKPSVTVAGIPQTVGRLGFDPLGSYQWYYDVDGIGIHNFAPDPPVGVGVSIVVVYKTQFTNIVIVKDDAEIAARQSIEGGSGRHEAIEEQRGIDSLDFMNALANGKLRQRGKVAKNIAVTVHSHIPEPGHRISINVPESEVVGNFLVEGAEYRWIIAKNDFIHTDIRATNLEPFGRPTQFFEKLVQMARIGSDPIESVQQSVPKPGDFGAGHYIDDITLNGNMNIVTPAVPKDRDTFTLLLRQDATGGRQITWDSYFHSSTPVDINVRPNKMSIFHFVGKSGQWVLLSIRTGVSQ